MKKLILTTIFFCGSICFVNSSSAQTLVPEDDKTPTKEAQKSSYFFDGLLPSEDADPYIAGKIKDGTISLNDMPLIMIRLIDLFSKIAGTIAVAMILWGGLQYVVSGVTEEKESAKNTLKYAVIGLAVTFLAWIGVNMLQIYITAPQETVSEQIE